MGNSSQFFWIHLNDGWISRTLYMIFGFFKNNIYIYQWSTSFWGTIGTDGITVLWHSSGAWHTAIRSVTPPHVPLKGGCVTTAGQCLLWDGLGQGTCTGISCVEWPDCRHNLFHVLSGYSMRSGIFRSKLFDDSQVFSLGGLFRFWGAIQVKLQPNFLAVQVFSLNPSFSSAPDYSSRLGNSPTQIQLRAKSFKRVKQANMAMVSEFFSGFSRSVGGFFRYSFYFNIK